MPLIVLLVAVLAFALLAVTGTVAGPWYIIGIPVILVAGFFLMVRGAGSERGRGGAANRPEPTGVPRSGSQGAETANERVGQASS